MSIPTRTCLLAATALLLLSTVQPAGQTSRPHGTTVTGADNPALISGTVDAATLTGRTRARAPRGARGYTLLNRRLLGETPAGLRVRVDPRARNRAAIARIAVRAVAAQRRQGIDIRWHGYGRPRGSEGTVSIRETAAGCRGGHGVVGVTVPRWAPLPDGHLYVHHAVITLCPRLFTRYGWRVQNATIRHELGHAVGLAHTNYVYRGSLEVMNAVVHRSTPHYQAGDTRGLRALAANNGRVRRDIPPIGRFERSTWRPNNTIRFTGWALLRYYRGTPVTITVTDNGHRARVAKTTVLRPGVNRHYDPGTRRHGFSLSVPWRGGKHTYCVWASSPRSGVARTNLGCTTWHS